MPAAVIPANVGTFIPCLLPKVPAPFVIPAGTVNGKGVVSAAFAYNNIDIN